MPTSLPMPTKAVGDIFTTTLWNNNLRDNLNKLLNTGHRVLTVAQFAALGAPEGTKGTVAPDEVYLEVDSTNGIQWHLAYESGEPTNKWRYLGGPPMWSEVLTLETTTSLTFVDLATVGASIVLSRAGDYEILWGCQSFNNAAGNGNLASVTGGGNAASDNYVAVTQGVSPSSVSRPRVFAVTASATMKLQYRVGGGTGSFSQRFIAIKPNRLI